MTIKEIRKVSNYLISSVFAQGSYLIVAFIVIRFLDEKTFTDIEIYTIYTQLIFAVFSLNLPGAILKFKSTYSSKELFLKFSSNIFFFGIISSIAVLITTIIVLNSPNFIKNFTLNPKLLWLLPISFLFYYFNYWIQYYLTSISEDRKFRNHQIFSGISKVISVVLLLFIFDEIDAEMKISFELFFLFIILLITLKRIKVKRPNKFFKKEIKKAAIFSAPLIMYSLFNNLLNYSDQLFISSYFSISDLAEYSASYKIATIILILYIALNNHYSVSFYDNYKNRLSIVKESRNLIFIISASTTIAIIFSEEILKTFTGWSGEKLLRSVKINQQVLVAYYTYTFFLLYSRNLYYQGKSLKISFMVILTALLNIILNAFFLKSQGVFFAAITTTISFLIASIASIIMYYMEDKQFSIHLVKYHLAGSLAVLISYLVF